MSCSIPCLIALLNAVNIFGQRSTPSAEDSLIATNTYTLGTSALHLASEHLLARYRVLPLVSTMLLKGLQPLTLQSGTQQRKAHTSTQNATVVQRPATCNAMRAGDHHSPSSHDEKQSLLSNINRIKMHGSYPDTVGKDAVHSAISGMQGALQGAKASAQDTLGWIRHALKDPDDFTSAAVGRMVSKAYGKHEPPHMEHHLWRTGSTPLSSPPSSPLSSTHHQPFGPSQSAPAAAPAGPRPVPARQAGTVMGHVQQHEGGNAGLSPAVKAIHDTVVGDAAGTPRDQSDM